MRDNYPLFYWQLTSVSHSLGDRLLLHSCEFVNRLPRGHPGASVDPSRPSGWEKIILLDTTSVHRHSKQRCLDDWVGLLLY